MDAPMSHTDYEQLAAGFVVGALEPDDEHAFQRHLSTCAACGATVRELEEVTAALAYAADPVEPPDTLRGSIRRAVARSAQRGSRVPWRAGIRAALVRRLAVAAAAVALVGLSFWNLSLRDENAAFERRVADHEQVSRLLNDETARQVTLDGRAGKATVLASSPHDEGVLVVERLPDLRRDRVYQFWAIPAAAGSQPLAGPVFRASGHPQVIPFRMDLQPNMTFAVTEEQGPRGSRRPTSAPVLTGAVSTPT